MGRMLNGKKKRGPSKAKQMVEIQLQGVGINIQNPCAEISMPEAHDEFKLPNMSIGPETQKWISEFISTKNIGKGFGKTEDIKHETSPGACHDFWRDGDW